MKNKKTKLTEEEFRNLKLKRQNFLKSLLCIIILLTILGTIISAILFASFYTPKNPIGCVEILNFDGTIEQKEFVKYKKGENYIVFYFENDTNKYTYPIDRVIYCLYN